MRTRTDTTFELARGDRPTVCPHKDCVSFSLPSYMTADAHGFSLHLRRAHLGVVQELLAALEALPELGEPFAEKA